MKLKCPNCKKLILLKQEYLYHAGFSNRGFLYCELCPTILEFSSYDRNYKKFIRDKGPWPLAVDEKQLIEKHLKYCPCGGRFRFDAPPKCPHCLGSIASLLPDKIHFVEVDKVIDADKNPDVWI